VLGFFCARRIRKPPRPRGLTLIEVLIASSLFVVVTGALLFTLSAGRNNLTPASDQTDALRGCLLVMEHLRQDLQAAWVLEPISGDTADYLTYRTPLRDAAGKVLTGPTGDIVWSPSYTASVRGDSFLREQDDQRRVMARLGPEGRLQVVRTTPTLLEITVTSSIGTGYSLKRSFRLKNEF
jgi:prepilin-type N-terminal cleavage/methylation domain-containing protein